LRTKKAIQHLTANDLPATDHVSPQIRSSIMRAVKSKGTRSTEWKLRSAIVARGIRGWRMNVQELPGKPDIVFSEKRLAIFIDGCFWHGCPKCYRRPQSNQSYWDAKVAKNIQRDKANRVQLRRLGWTVLRFWEHDFKVSPNNAAERIRMKIG
jgi:DNA mismatch endonuclease, patch repair protein